MYIIFENFKGSINTEERSQKKNGIHKEIEKAVIYTEHGEKITVSVENTINDGSRKAKFDFIIKEVWLLYQIVQ